MRAGISLLSWRALWAVCFLVAWSDAVPERCVVLWLLLRRIATAVSMQPAVLQLVMRPLDLLRRFVARFDALPRPQPAVVGFFFII